MSAQREAFEAWATKSGWKIGVVEGDGYRDRLIQLAWSAWQAGHAAIPAPAVRVPMSEAKIIEMLDEGYSGTVSLVRMVEAHHDIGVEL